MSMQNKHVKYSCSCCVKILFRKKETVCIIYIAIFEMYVDIYVVVQILMKCFVQEINVYKSRGDLTVYQGGVVVTSRLKGILNFGARPNYSHKKTKIERLCNLDRDSILVLRVAIFSSG